jgi:hypothetical protein
VREVHNIGVGGSRISLSKSELLSHFSSSFVTCVCLYKWKSLGGGGVLPTALLHKYLTVAYSLWTCASMTASSVV